MTLDALMYLYCLAAIQHSGVQAPYGFTSSVHVSPQ
jgi:hypothetical protein